MLDACKSQENDAYASFPFAMGKASNFRFLELHSLSL
jgi:hypothetical protein